MQVAGYLIGAPFWLYWSIWRTYEASFSKFMLDENVFECYTVCETKDDKKKEWAIRNKKEILTARQDEMSE